MTRMEWLLILFVFLLGAIVGRDLLTPLQALILPKAHAQTAFISRDASAIVQALQGITRALEEGNRKCR